MDGFVQDHDQDSSQDSDAGYKSMGTSTKVAKASTAGDQQVADANHIVDKAGADFNDSRNESASESAAADREDSWSKNISDGVGAGLEHGVAAAGAAFGSAAAGHASDAVFGGNEEHHQAEGDSKGGHGGGARSDDGYTKVGSAAVGSAVTATG